MADKDPCHKVITIPQYTGVCWFTALLMTLLYSSGMRELVLSKAATWTARSAKERALLAVFKEIATQHYAYEYRMKDKAYQFFESVKPEAILGALNSFNPAVFPFHPDRDTGFFSEAYMTSFLELLRVKQYLLLDAIPTGHHKEGGYAFTYSHYYGISGMNKADGGGGYHVVSRVLTAAQLAGRLPKAAPEAIVVFVRESSELRALPHYRVSSIEGHMPTVIRLPGRRYSYEVDSMLLGSHNTDTCSEAHQICGITCNGRRYIYNGWLREAVSGDRRVSRRMPCELMEVDWMSPGSQSFVIDRDRCGLSRARSSWLERIVSLGAKTETPVFHINKGSRTYIYVVSKKK